jgi:outer membrane protein assembly factor BamD (BamD/ComL family)
MAQIKFSKKHEIKEDRFIEWLNTAKIKTVEQKKNIFIGCFVIIVVAGLFLFFRWDNRQKNEAAEKLYGKAMVLFQEGKNQEAVDSLQKIYDEFSSTAAAPKSLFILANLDYQNGNYDNAIKFYEIFDSEFGKKDFMHAAAWKGLGSCYEQKKDYKKAAEYYAKIRKNFKDDFSIPEILMKSARCYLKMDMPGKAKSLCQEIIENYKETDYARQARLVLNSL